MTDSPFVRSGAVVRCPACDSKYRIKSAHFEREVLTGPKTLDETDSVLRSDSVDIDPDEVSPVSIDEEGNVVGLSGLSELMRWSDNQDQSQVTGTPSPTRSRGKQDPPTPEELPEARPAKAKTGTRTKTKTKTKSKSKPKPKPKPKAKAEADVPPESPGNARARASALKRKKRNKLWIIFGSVGVVVVLLAVIIPIVLPGNEPITTNEPDQDESDTAVVETDTPTPDTVPNPDTVNGSPGPKVPDEVRVFAKDYTPSPNPKPAFQPPWIVRDNSQPPSDVPTVLTPARPLTHEGWYVSNPPRGSADASGLINVEMSQLTAVKQGSVTKLTGTVSNKTNEVVMRGELHVMLLDSTASVFAETYVPLAMIQPKSGQAITMTIPTRYWSRHRGVRAGVRVSEWADAIDSPQDIRLTHTDMGPASAVRLSLKHAGETPLRNVNMLLSATDEQGAVVGYYHVEESNLYIANNQWLDLVIATPLPTGQAVAAWSAVLKTK